MTEKEFQRQVLQLAAITGWDLRYHTWNSRHSAKGFPDLVLAKSGRLIVAELKTQRGKATVEQIAWLAAFGAAGVPAYLWRPSDWDEIQAVLLAKE